MSCTFQKTWWSLRRGLISGWSGFRVFCSSLVSLCEQASLLLFFSLLGCGICGCWLLRSCWVCLFRRGQSVSVFLSFLSCKLYHA